MISPYLIGMIGAGIIFLYAILKEKKEVAYISFIIFLIFLILKYIKF